MNNFKICIACGAIILVTTNVVVTETICRCKKEDLPHALEEQYNGSFTPVHMFGSISASASSIVGGL